MRGQAGPRPAMPVSGPGTGGRTPQAFASQSRAPCPTRGAVPSQTQLSGKEVDPFWWSCAVSSCGLRKRKVRHVRRRRLHIGRAVLVEGQPRRGAAGAGSRSREETQMWRRKQDRPAGY